MNFSRFSRNKAWNTIPNTHWVSLGLEKDCAAPPGLPVSIYRVPTASAMGYDLPSLTGLILHTGKLKTPPAQWPEAFWFLAKSRPATPFPRHRPKYRNTGGTRRDAGASA